MRRGRHILERYERQLTESRDAQHVKTGCVFCRKTHSGTLAEGRAWHREHRAQHPQAGRGIKRKISTALLGGQNIHDNIQATRAQGGAQWEKS